MGRRQASRVSLMLWLMFSWETWIQECEHGKEFKVLPWLSNSPCLYPTEHLWGLRPIHGEPTSQLAGMKGSAVNISVLDTTGHVQTT